MYLPLSFPDIFLLVATILLGVTVLLLIKKINSKNYILIGSLAIYFSFVAITIVLIIVTRYNIKLINSLSVLVFMTMVYSLYNVFHFFSLQQLIKKNNNFKLHHFLHLATVVLLGVFIFYFLEPINSIKGKGYSYIFETQNLMLIQSKNFILPLMRILHPLIYFVYGGYLLYSFYRSPQYLTTQKPTRFFIFFLYFQKIFLFVSVLIGFIGFNIDSNLYSTISMLCFSINALIMSCYILLHPEMLIQITKPNTITKKKEVVLSNVIDLTEKLNRLMDQNKLFLDADYSLSKLALDSDMSATTIREIITTNGYKNFASYINSFRIAHAEKLIYNGYLDTYSIESLCNDSGFQAEVTFYRVFKRVHGCTPKEFSYNLKKTTEQLESIPI